MMRAVRALAALFVSASACTGVSFVAGSPRACAAGQSHVAVVVDFGPAGGTSSVCVPAGSHDNGAAVLAARASMLGTPPPRFNSSGLLCAIDGVPADGCGDLHDGKYAYWSYWHGDGGWSYSNVGPGGTRVDSGVVEGWRWNPAGAGNPTDPAPRGSATAAAICPTTPTAPRPTAPLPPVTSAGGIAPNPATVATTKPARSRNASTPATHGPQSASRNTASTRPTTRAATTTTTVPFDERAIAARAPAQHSGGGGAPVGLIVGVLLVAILAAGGIVATRMRQRGV